MNETTGRLLTLGNVAKVFEWGYGVVKLYNFATGNQTAFREAAIHTTVDAMGFPVSKVWSAQAIADRWGSGSIGEVRIIRGTNVERFR